MYAPNDMTKFIKRVVVFVFIFSAGFCSLLYLYCMVLQVPSCYYTDQSIDKIVLGNSHPQCALNDSLISDFRNFASSGESYMYSYSKAKIIIHNNPQLKYAFIELSNNMITDDIDNNWIRGRHQIFKNIEYYLPLLGIKELMIIFEDQWGLLAPALSKFLIKNSYSVLIELAGDGESVMCSDKRVGYYRLETATIDSLMAIAEQDEESKKYEKVKLSVLNLGYLDELLAYCELNNVKPILLRSPVHPTCTCLDNEDLYESLVRRIYGRYLMLDFKDFPLLNSDYADMDHLNYRGSEKFSHYMDKLIKAGVLLLDEPQAWIDSTICEMEGSDTMNK